MSSLHRLHAEKIAPVSRLRQMHAERIVLLPLLGGAIASIICLVAALHRLPGGEPPPKPAADHATPLISEGH